VNVSVGQTALHIAASAGHLGVVTLLMDAKVDVERRDTTGNTAFLLAVANGRKEVVKALLHRHLPPDHRDNHGFTALHLAAIFNQREMLESLLSIFVDGLNSGDNYGNTAPHYAILNDLPSIIDLLMARTDIEVNACNFKRQTPLHLGLLGLQSSFSLLKFMDDERVNINAVDYSGQSPTHQ
jgi:ankyrin repeat protein